MSLRFILLSLATCFVSGALAAPTPRPAPVPVPEVAATPPSVPDDLVSLKLADADIDTVLSTIEIYTGRTILRPQALPAATYSIKIVKPVPKAEAVLALETLLALNGVGVAPLGDKFLKVVALAQVKNEAPELIEDSTLGLPPSGRIATKLFQFEFLRATEFIPQIIPLMSPGIANGIVTLDKANAALITDSISNLQRVENLLRLLDRPSSHGLTPKFYTLHNGAKASDLVNRLRTMFQGPLASQLGSATSFSADDRTNQVILLADARQYPLFDELVEKLDVKADPNTRNEVIYLKHATAKDVATLLSALVSGQNAAQKSSESARPNALQPALTAAPNAPNVPAPAAPASVTLGEGTTNFSALVTILADDRSNAVVVSGTVDDIRLIRDLVDKIDIVLAQVRIEVIIAEVTLTDTDKSGISALNLTVSPNTKTGALQITNFTGSVAGWNVSAGVVNPLSFAAAMTDAGSRHKVKILSAPTIVTTHNKQASFAVTQQQPVITGTTSTPTSGSSTTGFSTNSSVTYKDIGIQLKVTPLIGDDGSIQLQIDQVVDDVLSNVTIDNNQQPVIGHREANSFVNVNDGQMIVLGGLQRSANTADRNKLGFLHEIPILSHILGGRTNEVDRTELLLFIRPHVLRPEDGSADTTKKIDELSNKGQIQQFLTDPVRPAKDSLIEKLK
ncbi:MAG: general secretion pathway protein D [Verrucomicrobia bacterium]|nr:MAG: general secretion pathway protein D [Verrucomicrobiota bacterium]